jgi:mannose-6-phosphate isomerase-like protein (cupin superfamily)
MSINSHGYALAADEGEALWFLGNLVTVKAAGKETNGRFTLLECVAPPGFAPPPHLHRREDEAFYLLAGEMTITCADQSWWIGPGGFAFLPQGVPHGFRVGEAGPATMLQLTLPAQFERFAAAVGVRAPQRALPPRADPDIPKLLDLMAQYGIELAPPSG